MLYLVANTDRQSPATSRCARWNPARRRPASPARTRTTGVLCSGHFDIHKPQIAFHEHNEQRAGEISSACCTPAPPSPSSPAQARLASPTPGYSLVRRRRRRRVSPSHHDPRPAGLIVAVVLSRPAAAQLHLPRLPRAERAAPLPRRRPNVAPHPHLLQKALSRLAAFLLEDALARLRRPTTLPTPHQALRGM